MARLAGACGVFVRCFCRAVGAHLPLICADPQVCALRLLWGFAASLLRAAAGGDGRYAAPACVLLAWLRANRALAAAPAAAAAPLRLALAALLNAAPLRARAAHALGAAVALNAALSEDWALRGFAPCEAALRGRAFACADADAAAAEEAARPDIAAAVRAARIVAAGAWACRAGADAATEPPLVRACMHTLSFAPVHTFARVFASRRKRIIERFRFF
jgi:hypothetical protein